MSESVCKGCGKPIVWGTTENGAKIPLSKVKVPYLLLDSGRAVKVEGPLFDAISADSSLKKAPVIYQSHFQDCPKASNF